MEYVLPLHLTALLLFACMIPLAKPAMIMKLPMGESNGYLIDRDNPFFASRMLAI